ncbi:MAG: ATP synthase F1 subunit gamma [Candidatus Binatia bacterium]|nr:ATP synthase F1 subunit gamma [Candidatus Binatia bacterium]
MPSLKAIRTRISSVKNTQQITKAMKMVAASKLRRAQEAAVQARPYSEKLEGMVAHLLQRVDPAFNPLMKIPESQERCLVLVVSSDKGLCGGYNANLLREAEEFVADQPGEFVFMTVGSKGYDHLKRREYDIEGKNPMPAAKDAAALARELSRALQRSYLAGEVDRVVVAYSAFKSTMTQIPTIEQLLPLQHHDEPEGHAEGHEYVFEPNPIEIIGSLLPRLVEVRILHALLEAGASELASRMTAMDSATRNASEMIDRLTLQMNRARQAQITTELMEIISGAEALNQ